MGKKLKRVKAAALFEGAIPDRIPVIDKQCERLIEAREETGKARLREREIQNKIIELFHSETPPLKQYRHETSGKIFKIDAPEKIHYKAAPKPGKASASEEDGEDDEEESKKPDEAKLVEA